MKSFGSMIRTAAAVWLSIALGVAQAAVIYDNGGPNAVSGNDATQWTQAEDFTLAGGGSVTGASVYIAGFNGIGNWDGTADYYLYADAGGSPGALLASGAGLNVSTTDTGIPWCCGGNAFRLDFDLVSPFAAAAGTTYWLGIHLSSNFDRDDIYWVTTAANGTATGHECIQCTQGAWSNFGNEHAFQLHGADVTVPEPGTLALLGLALAGLAASRRRKL